MITQDPSRMTAFVSFVADVAIRCRDLCCSERDEALSCRVRRDLHGLVLLLRRPDKSREEPRMEGVGGVEGGLEGGLEGGREFVVG